jgi:hypothetical protein
MCEDAIETREFNLTIGDAKNIVCVCVLFVNRNRSEVDSNCIEQ